MKGPKWKGSPGNIDLDIGSYVENGLVGSCTEDTILLHSKAILRGIEEINKRLERLENIIDCLQESLDENH